MYIMRFINSLRSSLAVIDDFLNPSEAEKAQSEPLNAKTTITTKTQQKSEKTRVGVNHTDNPDLSADFSIACLHKL